MSRSCYRSVRISRRKSTIPNEEFPMIARQIPSSSSREIQVAESPSAPREPERETRPHQVEIAKSHGNSGNNVAAFWDRESTSQIQNSLDVWASYRWSRRLKA